MLKWQDTSTGNLVAEFKTKIGPCEVLRQNPNNAICCAGHANGCVTMWSPTMSTPLVKMFCHRGPLTAIAVEKNGNHMVTAGLDGQMKVWDIRTFKNVHNYFNRRPATTLDVSQRGLGGRLRTYCGDMEGCSHQA